MKQDDDITRARRYLQILCDVRPNRRTGSPGNRHATDFLAGTLRSCGYDVDATLFECLDHVCDGARLTGGADTFEVYASPYTLGCDVLAELVAVSSVEELECTPCEGKILLLRGDICTEQLMPKGFVFYNPEHHQRIIALLERHRPAGIVTATSRQPEQVGALYPAPLIVDGDFDIPSVYCRDSLGDSLAARQGESFRLRIDARRIPSSAANVVARLRAEATSKIIVTAHLDAYEGSPGATDNASGVVVLLLCAEMLADYGGEHCIEFAALNGEDHYSAGGQMDYLQRYGSELPRVLLAANVDDVGFRKGRSSYSFYGCPAPLHRVVGEALRPYGGLVPGEPWFSGDHMIFVQAGVPAIAITSEYMPELLRTVTHTPADTPDIVGCAKLVEIATSLSALVRSL